MGANSTRTRLRAVLLALPLIAMLPSPATSEDFFAGKTISIVVGGSAGGGHDLYARTIARHLARFIPGNPGVVVRNMPGAGSMRAAGHVYAVAPKDGTTIAALYPGSIMTPLLDPKSKATYEPTRFQYLGSAESGARICATYQKSRIKTFQDAVTQPSVFGGSAAGGSVYEYGHMLRNTAGAKFRIVTGYKATLDMTLDMERGEIDGICGWDWSTAKSQKPDWLRDKIVNILVQVALDADPELTKLGVPPIWGFIKNEGDRKAVELVVSQQVFSRPHVVAPETPAERVALLRAAYEAVMVDKQFLADATKARLDISPSHGAKLQKLVASVYATPAAIVERARRIIAP
ncbi:MAG: Bug family tripartite tricarboxylate transporter substrate binding protein [Xanthobacteraceae bacterium]